MKRSGEITRATKVMIMKSCDVMTHNSYDFSLNLTEQDLLDEKLEPDKDTYWIKKEVISFEKEAYTKQF